MQGRKFWATEKDQVLGLYANSLLWVAIIFAIILVCSNVTAMVVTDFFHADPYRSIQRR